MSDLRYVLLSDGSSDNALVPLLTWIIRQNLPSCAIQPRWADLGHLRRPPKNLAEKIFACKKLYDFDLLFVHRDAESQPRELRVAEIQAAVAKAGVDPMPVVCCVVPVRMQEAWLLFDESAIRKASGNPSGRIPLNIPPLPCVEREPDPKSLLHQLLLEASGLSAHRKKRFKVAQKVHRVPVFIADFSPLRGLSAFDALEADIKIALSKIGR